MPPAAALSALGGRTFASLYRHREFRRYYAGAAVSFVGTFMQQIAAFWLAVELTGSPVAVGGLATAQALPITALALFGGTIADRADLRRLLIVAETGLALTALALAVLTLTGAITIGQLYLLALVNGTLFAIDHPARQALVFRIVGPADLANAIGLQSGLGTTARILGPGVGGLVVAFAGPGVAFGLNAASYLAMLAVLATLRLPPRAGVTAPPRLFTGVRDSLAYAVSTRRIAVAFFSVLLVSVFSFNFDVLLPLLARETLDAGAGTFGLLGAVFGAGALVGALTVATLGQARLKLVLVGAAGFGGCQLLLAPQTLLPAVCALLFVIGVFYVLWGSSALAVLQLSAPEHLRARAASLYVFAFQGGAPLGGLIAGTLTAWGGTRLAFASAGAVALVVAFAGARSLGFQVRRPVIT